MNTPAKWFVCHNCSMPFTSYTYRSHCVVCGGDDKINWARVIAFCAAVDLLLALPLIWRLWRG